ncbi:MAG TPA: putative glycolipid-binding domain-containing protein [Anaerolineaceae bacterium]|nr:putative glycolipid-binding domain-containing protein [Anaerolineaceae bacterium]
MLERHVFWCPWDEPGLEHLHLLQDERGFLADGMILRVIDGHPLRAHYRIRCDPAWRIKKVELDLPESGRVPIRVQADGNGGWLDESGEPIPLLDGCTDMDISITPFTNTLPIRRLELKPGETGEIRAAYFAIPEMEVRPVQQRYTCLEISAIGGIYRYEEVGQTERLTADLQVDADKLVLDYTGLFRRVWSGG